MAEANPRTFDLFDPAEVITQAQAIVKLPRDRNSLFQMAKLEEQINKTANPDEVATLEARKAELKAKVDKSCLRVTLCGVDKILLDSISDALEAESKIADPPMTEAVRDDKYQMKVLESMLVKIEDSEGNVGVHPGDRTGEWFNRQPPENRMELVIAMKDLSFEAYKYNADTINPDF